VTGDVTSLAQVQAVRGQVEEELGTVGILVANAGGNLTPPAALEDIPEEGWRATVDANLLATFLTLKSFLPGMKERRRGCVITIASAAGRRADPRSPIPYAAAEGNRDRIPERQQTALADCFDAGDVAGGAVLV
jgi:3-oxoacyl-[acyl-carrier protein] reductase